MTWERTVYPRSRGQSHRIVMSVCLAGQLFTQTGSMVKLKILESSSETMVEEFLVTGNRDSLVWESDIE